MSGQDFTARGANAGYQGILAFCFELEAARGFTHSMMFPAAVLLLGSACRAMDNLAIRGAGRTGKCLPQCRHPHERLGSMSDPDIDLGAAHVVGALSTLLYPVLAVI